MLDFFLMWFPISALFVAVAWITELAWKAKDQKLQPKQRRIIFQEDGKPLMYED